MANLTSKSNPNNSPKSRGKTGNQSKVGSRRGNGGNFDSVPMSKSYPGGGRG